MSNSRSLISFRGSKSNFTIEHILNLGGEKYKVENSKIHSQVSEEKGKYEWLTCTRYKPPKLTRQRKKTSNLPKKLRRKARVPFSSFQVAFLEARFLETPYLTNADVIFLAKHLKLTETRVKIWFQNRRAREKKGRSDLNEPKKLKIVKASAPNVLITTPQSWPKFLTKDQNLESKSEVLQCEKEENERYEYSKSRPLDLSEKRFKFEI